MNQTLLLTMKGKSVQLHQVPVCAQLLVRLHKYEPVVEDAHTPRSLRKTMAAFGEDFGEDAKRQG